jgi:tRNA pseudouridine32 synthase/23S rRNA pseudouridine746 synthase
MAATSMSLLAPQSFIMRSLSEYGMNQRHLPTRDGVSPSFAWLPHGSWATLGDYLAFRFPMVDEGSWRARMARGEVVDEQGQPVAFDDSFRGGACIFYYRERQGETPIPFQEEVLFLNDELLVVDKPHFLPVTPGGRFLHETLLVRLKRRTGIDTLVPVHRLDRETAGVMLLSVNPATRSLWQSLFRYRQVDKVYEALAPFRHDVAFPIVVSSRIERSEQFFRVREVEGEPNAFSRIELMAQRDAHALYRLFPSTGKMHQLRVHMNSLGIPILNDSFYPVALPCKGDDFSAPLKLLARSLHFSDPVTGETRHFESRRQLD